ncbi:putative F-box protein At1g53360 [Papaver somniferum]|uniref:putative F-box protein At1g53360 n=1 Tax=Papaver somniferum TaxID=3469 RepID=UPI000E6F6D19|nr:putative F-box protein At1g53360 [Papaver somniferum]
MNIIPPFKKAYQYHYGPAYICNPITREYVMLPKSEGHYRWNRFGYTHSTSEYKVVRKNMSAKGDSNVRLVQIYTLGSGNGWRDVENVDMELKNVPLCAGVFANGALHWVDLQKGTIIAFHLTDKKFSELPSPPLLTQDGDPVYYSTKVAVLGDFLSVTYSRNAGACEIWLLKKKNKDNFNELSWSKEFSFGSFEIYISRPSGYTKSGRLLYYWHNHIYRYDPKDSSAKMDAKIWQVLSQYSSSTSLPGQRNLLLAG